MKALLIVALLGLMPSLFAEAGFGYSNVAEFDTVDPVLTLSSPLGWEVWYIGEEYDLQWTTSDTNISLNSTGLFYSTDGGDTYTTIAEFLPMGGSHAWYIPAEPSITARVRVIGYDTFGNSGQDENSDFFEMRYMNLKPPDNLAIVIDADTDALLSWDAVSETVNEVPLAADGYYVFHGQTPEEEDFSYLDTVSINSFTHANAANLYPRSFYYVIAYADEDGKAAAVLKAIAQQGRLGSEPLTLERFRKLLSGRGGY